MLAQEPDVSETTCGRIGEPWGFVFDQPGKRVAVLRDGSEQGIDVNLLEPDAFERVLDPQLFQQLRERLVVERGQLS